MTIPGATPFGHSSPSCDEKDDPIQKLPKEIGFKVSTPLKRNQIPLRNIRGFGKTTFFEKKKKTELFKKDFWVLTVPGWNFYSLGFIVMVIEMVR
jgi:hypothetical protein